MFVDYPAGDISIKKVENGWILIEAHHSNEDELMYTVFESDLDSREDIQVDDAHSLMRLIGDAFEMYCQSKRRGGMVLGFETKGWEDLEEDEDQEDKENNY